MRLALIVEPTGPQTLAAVLPMDAALPVRLRALSRLWRLLEGAPPGPDPLSPQRRQRLKAMLRAVDGRWTGAPYREVANGLYGMARVASEPWKTSSLRDATMRLVRDGRAMVEGGYRSLLSRGA